jgi:tetratricopeptide (TPR) repeat protein
LSSKFKFQLLCLLSITLTACGQQSPTQSNIQSPAGQVDSSVSDAPPSDLFALEQQVAGSNELQKYDKAIKLYADFEKSHGRDLDDKQIISFNSGFVKVLLGAGKIEEAEKRTDQVLREAERKYGPDSANARTALVDAISVTERTANREKRNELMERFLTACEKQGNQHRLLKALTLWESGVSYNCGEPVRHDRLEKLLQLRKNIHGPLHPLVLQSRLSCARNLSNQGKLEESSKMLKELIADASKSASPPEFQAGVKTQYGKLLFKQDNDKAAEKEWKEASALLVPLINTDPGISSSVVEILSNLGFLYYRHNHYSQALPYYKQAVDILQHQNEYTSIVSEDMFAKYISCLEQTGKKGEAVKTKALIATKREKLKE